MKDNSAIRQASNTLSFVMKDNSAIRQASNTPAQIANIEAEKDAIAKTNDALYINNLHTAHAVVQALAQKLQSNSTLTFLSIQYCNLGYAGAQALLRNAQDLYLEEVLDGGCYINGLDADFKNILIYESIPPNSSIYEIYKDIIPMELLNKLDSADRAEAPLMSTLRVMWNADLLQHINASNAFKQLMENGKDQPLPLKEIFFTIDPAMLIVLLAVHSFFVALKPDPQGGESNPLTEQEVLEKVSQKLQDAEKEMDKVYALLQTEEGAQAL